MKRGKFDTIVKFTALLGALYTANTPLAAPPPGESADSSMIALPARPIATEAQFEYWNRVAPAIGIVTAPTSKATATAIIVPGAGNLDENGDDGAFVKGWVYPASARTPPKRTCRPALRIKPVQAAGIFWTDTGCLTIGDL